MATDGVKIIDGDIAHDIYHGFMDMFNHGATIEALKNEYMKDKEGCTDEEEYEICVTAYALAFWEIGEMTAEILKDVEEAIAKQAGVISWTFEAGEKKGKARQKELDNFWVKINHPREKPRKSKNYKKVTEFLLKQGNVLMFQNLDKTYSITVVTDISQTKGKCYYTFSRTLSRFEHIPKIEDIENVDFIGSRRGISLTPWLWGLELEQKQLKKCINKFQYIGDVSINGNGRCYDSAISFEDFCAKFPLSEQEKTNANYMGRKIHKFNFKELIPK